jgi:transposase
MKTTNQQNNAQADGAPVVSKQYRCVKLGLDVHADSIRVVRMIDGATPQPAQKMTPDEFPKWAAKQLTLADRVCSCYEAGPLGYGLHRKLLALGIENIVIRPLVLDEYRVRVKTDKTDALALTKRLDTYVRGNRKAFAAIRVPSEQEEQDRTLSRQREQLVREARRLADSSTPRRKAAAHPEIIRRKFPHLSACCRATNAARQCCAKQGLRAQWDKSHCLSLARKTSGASTSPIDRAI